jgi:glycosyltransferase involved in cell wall biosynthesis
VGAQLIHTNMEILLEGALAARWLGLPHVLHYRGNTLDTPKLVFDGLTAVWTGGADLVYCISEATAGVFRRRNRGRKVEVLYNPVELASFREAIGAQAMRAQLGANPGERLVGTVGRIHPRKDLETFVRAAALVTRAMGKMGKTVKFVVVGAAEADVELSYRTQLDDLVRSLNLGDTLRFAGALRDMPAVMGALDVFALTSRHEGFGRVVAEAMAAGRPVVVSDEGALPELVGRGAYGRVAAALDPGQFADRILELLGDRNAADRLGARAAEAASQFDGAIIADRVWSRYETLIAHA